MESGAYSPYRRSNYGILYALTPDQIAAVGTACPACGRKLERGVADLKKDGAPMHTSIRGTQFVGCRPCQQFVPPEARLNGNPMHWQTPESEIPAPTPTPTPKAQPVTPTDAPANPQAAALAALLATMSSGVTAEQAQEIAVKVARDTFVAGMSETLEAVREIVAESGAVPVKISVGEVPPVEIASAHTQLQDVVKRAAIMQDGRRVFRNLLLTGPAGSGKTTLAQHLAEVLSIPFGMISCQMGMPVSRIEGRIVPSIHDGTEKYHGTPFLNIYERGGVFVFDEADAADPSTLLVINAALANGTFPLPDGRTVTRHDDCMVVLILNTRGDGASSVYAGRNALDGATLDRFVGASMQIGYCPTLERTICPTASIRNAVEGLRKKVADLKLRRVVGTRSMIAAYALHHGASMNAAQVLDELTRLWSDADRKAVGVTA